MKLTLSSFYKKFIYLFLFLIFLFILFIVVILALTPLLNDHKNDFENQLQSTLNMPVSIQNIHVSWYRYQPVITFNHTIIKDPKTNKALFQIHKMNLIVFVFKSLWKRQIVISGIMMDGVDLTIYQEKTGLRIEDYIIFKELSFKPQQTKMSSPTFINLISLKTHFILDNITLTYVDINQKKRVIHLNHFNLDNGLFSHSASGTIVLVQKINTEVAFSVHWKGDLNDLKNIKANAYVYIVGLNLSQWLKGKIWKDWEIREGLGSLKLWIKWRDNRLKKIQSVFRLFDLNVFSHANRSNQEIKRLSGNIGWKHEHHHEIFAGNDLIVDFPDQLWPVNNFYLEYIHDNENPFLLNTFNLSYLNLKKLEDILKSSQNELPRFLHDWLQDISLSGSINDLKIRLKDQGNWQSATLDGNFKKLTLYDRKTHSGFANVNGSLNIVDRKGELTLISDQLKIQSNLFPHPLMLGKFFTRMKGNLDLHYFAINFSSFSMANTDFNLSLLGDLKFDKKRNQAVDLSGKFEVPNVSALKKYLPIQLLNDELSSWLKNALKNGSINEGNFKLTGVGSQINPIVNFKVKDAKLLFSPLWPNLENINGEFNFDKQSMQAHFQQASLENISLTNVSGVIADFKKPILSLKTDMIKSDFEQGKHFILESPLAKNIGQLYSYLNAKGPLTIDLNLNIPLFKPDKTTLEGKLDFDHALLTVNTLGFNIDNLKGDLFFTDKKIFSDQVIIGQLFDQAFYLTLSTQKNKNILVRFNTQLLLKKIEEKFNIHFSDYISGMLPLNGEIHYGVNDALKMIFTSDLKGVNISLMSPLNKKLDEKKQAKLNVKMKNNHDFEVQLNYASSQLNLKPFFDNLKKSQEKSFEKYLINIHSDIAEGEILLPKKIDQHSLIKADFKNIKWNEMSAKINNDFSIDFTHIPGMDIEIENFIYQHQNLGSIQIQSRSLQHTLIFEHLQLDNRLLLLEGNGSWEKDNQHEKIKITGIAKTHQLSELLSRFGIDVHNFIATESKADFDLSSNQSPLQRLSLSKMDGHFNFSIGKGRIVDIGDSENAKIGLGRMLSLFSLQSIPRRLSLDFSDIFQKGFSFDYISGDFDLNNGNAYTNNLKINGPLAKVDIHGRIGFQNKDFDLTLSIVPAVVSSLPLAAALINPYIGIAAWGVNKLLGSPVSKMTTYTYHVEGTWENPKWQSVSLKKS